MTHRSRWAVVALTATAVLAGFGATTLIVHSDHNVQADQPPAAAGGLPQGGARTSLPGLKPASGEPTLPGFHTAQPASGTVARVPGPFDERYSWSHLHLDGSRVSGDLTVTSDVSDLLELQVMVGFYDAGGRLLDIRRVVRHNSLIHETASGVPDESQRVVVDVPRHLRATTVAAAVGIPVLVNE